jgi:hypothetical protein
MLALLQMFAISFPSVPSALVNDAGETYAIATTEK